MLRSLLLRDLRLAWSALILPLGLALVSSLLMHRERENPMTLVAFSLLVALLIPHAIHLREEQHQTLGDLRALPVTPTHIVALRVLEGLLGVAAATLLHALATLLLQGPGAFTGLSDWLSPGWLWMVLLLLALPLPVTLRWGGRGWLVLVVGLFVCFGGLVWLGQVYQGFPGGDLVYRAIARSAAHLSRHPGQHLMGLLALIAACLPLAAAAYRRRDA